MMSNGNVVLDSVEAARKRTQEIPNEIAQVKARCQAAIEEMRAKRDAEVSQLARDRAWLEANLARWEGQPETKVEPVPSAEG